MNKTIDYSSLFRFRDPFSNRWLRLDPLSDWVVNTEVADNLAFKGWLPPKPVIFKGYMGGPIADVLWTGLPPLFCVSERVITILKENNFTGWSTFPVLVSDRKGIELPGYYGFAVTSYAGERDLTRSPVVLRSEPYIPGGGRPEVYKGFYFDEGKWDGSDIFHIKQQGIIVTGEVKNALMKAKIRNVEFIALPDEETDTIIFND